MSVSMVLQHITPERYLQVVQDAIDKALHAARDQSSGKDIIVRDLRQQDVSNLATDGDSQLSQTNATADTIENHDIGDVTLDQDEAWAIYGVAILSAAPSLTRFDFFIGSAQLIASFDFASALALQNPVVVWTPPVLYKGLEVFRTQILANDTTAQLYAYLGVVAEPAGKVINPRPGPVVPARGAVGVPAFARG